MTAIKVIGIIPARGGSKGIPRKNLVEVCGKPLIQYTFAAAKESSRLTDVVLSTDDKEIARIGRRNGIEVPFMRPPELASDTSATIDVVRFTCEMLAKHGRQYDAVCLLQPTSPQRSSTLIDDCIHTFASSDADSLITVTPVPLHYNPMWVYSRNERGELQLFTGGNEPVTQRQLLPPAFVRDGRIYLTRIETVMNDCSLYGQTVSGFQVPAGINIDTPEDLARFQQQEIASRS